MTEEQLLNVPGLAAVMVDTRVRDLLPTAQRCIDAGKHIGLDKPAGDSLPKYTKLLDSAAKHAKAGLAHVASGDYAGEHWLASFAVYFLTE